MTDSDVVDHEQTSSTATDLEWIDYAEFGRRFVAEAVSDDRIAAAIGDIAGKGVKIGPASLGPGGLAGFFAEGAVGEPVVKRHEDFDEGGPLRYDVVVPASLVLSLRLGRQVRLRATVEIALQLTPRAAAPLFIVIDIPRVEPDDVTLTVRAEASGSAWEWLLDPLTRMTRNEVANRLNAMLFDPAAIRRRVFDVRAMMNKKKDQGKSERSSKPTEFEWLTDQEFGKQFFRDAVTNERISKQLSTNTIEIGPLKTGPKDMATVAATGEIGEPHIEPRDGDLVSFDLTIPVVLDLVITIAKENHYRADIEVPVRLVGRAADPLLLVIDLDPVDPEDVEVTLKSKGLSASVLRVVGGVKKQIRDQVVRQINRQVGDPSSRTVDIGAQIGSRV